MYRLMIVDDEEILRKGLINTIDWAGNGIEVVGEAKNGMDALEQIEETMPEIILSDIKMPFMDGLELAEYVYRAYPNIKTILLTAYQEFEYAQKAVQYKVYNYILKSEDNETILNGVLDAIGVYKAEKKTTEIINRNKKYLVNNLFRDICYKGIGNDDIEKRAAELGFTIRDGHYCVATVKIEDIQKNSEGKRYLQRNEKLQIITKSIIGHLEDEGYYVWNFSDKKVINIIINLQDDNEQSKKILVNLLDNHTRSLEEDLQVLILIGMGKIYEQTEQIYKSFQEASAVVELEYLPTRDRKLPRVILSEMFSQGHGASLESIENISHFIKENYYDEKLSLAMISEQVHLSPNYISTLFKRHNNMNISDYIIKTRMKHAEKLLIGTDYKTYEIANAIGYTNSQYFSVLFKKTRGVSPTEFRQKNTGIYRTN